MKKSKFKVGDKVIVTDELRNLIVQYGWHSEMLDYIGTKSTIINTINNLESQVQRDYGERYSLENKNGYDYYSYFFVEECLELVEPYYKEVVLEISEQDLIIDYDYLENNDACKEVKIWFVNHYGFRNISCNSLIERITYRHIHTSREEKDWIQWLKDKQKKECIVKSKNNYVSIENIDSNNIYILMSLTSKNLYIYIQDCYGNGFRCIHEGEQNWNWCNHSSIYRNSMEDSFKTAFKIIKGQNAYIKIYEFKTYKNFIRWIKEEYECE